MTNPTITIATPYGPLVARFYAGPTSAPGHGYLRDGIRPDEAHAFGRDPDAAHVGARVGTPDRYNSPTADTNRDGILPLTVNGVSYTADVSYTLGPTGWREERGSFGPLTRVGSFETDYAAVTDGARKVWREVIVPMVIDALDSATNEAATAIATARAAFVADVLLRVQTLRNEADRLADMIDPRRLTA